MNKEELAWQLELEEGRVPYVYLDHLGFQTIGIGRLIDRRKGGHLRDYEIDYLLRNDIIELGDELLQDYPWLNNVGPVRFDAFILARFQLGRLGLALFRKALAAAKVGNWEQCATEFKDSLWYKQTTARVDRLCQQLITNRYVYKQK